MKSTVSRLWYRVALHGAAVATLLGAAAASAQERGWYAGGSYESTKTEISAFDFTASEHGSSADGYGVYGGWRLNDHYAFDAALKRNAGLEVSHAAAASGLPDNNSHVMFDASALQLSVLAIAEGELLEGYVRFGVSDYRLDGTRNLSPASGAPGLASTDHVSTQGTGFLMGLGGGANLPRGWHVGIEYSLYDVDDAFFGTEWSDAWLESVTLNLEHRFGKRAQPQ
jgi:hypothetical protein